MMEQVVPWARLIEVIEPHYPKSGKRGRPLMGWPRAIGLARMLSQRTLTRDNLNLKIR